ncbi:long-chain-fatty-acid--CoA ligase FadD2 [soil metagenome]
MIGPRDITRTVTGVGTRAVSELRAVEYIARTGILRPQRLDKALGAARSVLRYGLGGVVAATAARTPNRPAIADELGDLSYAELDLRSNALANSMAEVGVTAGTGVGILCRNHRGFLEATIAVAKLGATALYLNTDFAGPQIREVCAREGVELLIRDEEYASFTADTHAPLGTLTAWCDGQPGPDALGTLIDNGDDSPPPSPSEHGKVVLLTSGTTGTPKGAPREAPRSLIPAAALISKVPIKAGEATHVAAPMFHALGFAHTLAALAFGSTISTRRRFDPEQTLADVEAHHSTALIVVPVMLQRILSLEPAVLERYDTSSMRILFCAGAQLEADLATRALEHFGDVVYNLYGSTEVAYASIATPADLRAAPGCAGKPPLGTTIRLLDEAGVEVPRGNPGRIFVSNGFQFEGYTGGGNKEIIDGLMSTGDVGHFDEAGRLFIDGRDDEMIVSGGENVFPREIEELLLTHDAIDEAAAIGVRDEVHGQRLRAFVTCPADATLDEAQVKTFVKENLARFKVPREVIFLEEMPRNPSGKILKRELAEHEPAAKPL